MTPGKLLVVATASLLWAGSAAAQTPIIYDVTFEGFPLGAPPPTSDTLGDRPFRIDSNLGAAVLNRSRMPSDSLPVINDTQFVRMTESCGSASAMVFDKNQSVSSGIVHAGFDVLFETFERYLMGFRNGRQSSGGVNGSAARILADIFTLGEPVPNNMRFVSGENVAPFSATISYEIGIRYRIDAYFDMDSKRWHVFINGGSFENHKVVDNAPIIADAPIGFAYFGFNFSSFCEGQSPTQPPIPGASFSGAMQFDNFVFERVASIPGGPPPLATPKLSKVLTGVGRAYGMAVHGGHAYVADSEAHTVWKVDLTTAQKTEVAGIGWKAELESQDKQGYNGDGIESKEAQLANPSGVAVDVSGNIYIADKLNHAIRKIGAESSFITTFAGIPTSSAVGESVRLFEPSAVAVDPAGNVYLADMMNQQVKKVDKTTGATSVVVGVAGRPGNNDGPAVGPDFCTDADCTPAARLNSAMAIAVDAEGIVYIAEDGNGKVRKVTLGGNVTTLQVGGLRKPTGVAVTPDGGTLYIADYGNHKVLRATECESGTCTVTTIAGTGTPGSSGAEGSPASAVQLNSPTAVVLDGDLLYIADKFNERILVIDLTATP